MARPSSILPGIMALLLGTWTGLGGCMVALGSLSGNSEVPDNPMLSGAQNRAVQELMLATASYDPVNAALSALSALIGPLLIVAGVVLIAHTSTAGLVGRFAFGASMVVDALHALWSVLWFGLVWGPMSDYVEAIAKGLPNKPPGFMDSLDAFTAVAIVITALLGVAYFAIKIGIAGLGFRFSGRIDREDTADEAPPPVDPNLGWAD